MNMLFIEAGEAGLALGRGDPRRKHISSVLKKGPGDELAAGRADGRLGVARIEADDEDGMTLSFVPGPEAPPLRPVTLLLGFPRPIQANRILKDLASLGVARIMLSGTELGEKSYFQSDFFKNREFRSALIEGAEQAGNPRLPVVETAWTLARALDAIVPEADDAARDGASRFWAFDPYRAERPFGSVALSDSGPERPLVLAIGSERGWTDAELDLLSASGFSFASLGDRILKTATACVVAVAMALGKLGYI
ncbi:MAG TPA: RsmE family RNA methyltransferase, partial [Spirochaetales bacterium]|nr:RsmE family RNA methyltransferase [Spirochaetales bacterium]